MAVIYSEDFSSYTAGQTPTDFSFLGTSWTVETNSQWGGTKGVKTPAGVWMAAVQNTNVLSNGSYFEYKVRCDNGGSRNNIVWNIQNLTLNGATPVGCYIYQYVNGGSNTLFRGWNGGVGGLVILGSKTATPSNQRDYELKIIQQGSNIECFLDGVSQITATDSNYTSGYVGLQAFNNSITYFTDLTVDDGTSPPTPPAALPPVGGIYLVQP